MLIRLSTVLLAAFIFASCSGTGGDEPAQKPVSDKPATKTELTTGSAQPEKQIFDSEQIARGEKLFNEKCVKCHKKYAEGEPYWQTKDKDGNFPPPPLDGTAHAWHHPTEVLIKYIKKGGKEYGGTMKGFEGDLTDSQITDIIVWITSLWPKDVYDKWYRRDQMTRNWKKDASPPM
ncbi:MAG: c-type cytochrome [Nitrospinota bacterium]